MKIKPLNKNENGQTQWQDDINDYICFWFILGKDQEELSKNIDRYEEMNHNMTELCSI